MNITGFNTFKLNVQKKDGTITVQSPDHGRRTPRATNLTITQSEDQVQIRGSKDRESMNWNINLSPTGAEVVDPSPRRTRRGGGRGMRPNHPGLGRVELPEGVRLEGEQLQEFGLSVAGALVGLPLGILTN